MLSTTTSEVKVVVAKCQGGGLKAIIIAPANSIKEPLEGQVFEVTGANAQIAQMMAKEEAQRRGMQFVENLTY